MTDDSDNTISMKVEVKTTDKNGKVTKSNELKTYKRDPGKDKYDTNGIPSEFAWTHEKTETEKIEK